LLPRAKPPTSRSECRSCQIGRPRCRPALRKTTAVRSETSWADA
jgi:hypothetical protein